MQLHFLGMHVLGTGVSSAGDHPAFPYTAALQPTWGRVYLGRPEPSEGSAVFFSSDVVEGARESRSRFGYSSSQIDIGVSRTALAWPMKSRDRVGRLIVFA
jgi:hypothetical protein